jgi:hypothetical protein
MALIVWLSSHFSSDSVAFLVMNWSRPTCAGACFQCWCGGGAWHAGN